MSRGIINTKPYFLSIDIGTTNLKCVLFDESGKIVGRESAPHPTHYSDAGFAEQDPFLWTSHLQKIMKKLDDKYHDAIPSLSAISLTGQMHGPVFLNKNEKTIFPCIIWSDTRAKKEVDSLKKQFPPSFFPHRTGNPLQASFTLPKILWVKNHFPDLYQCISKMLFPKDYVGYCLSGNISTDPSDASGSLLYDILRQKWSDEIGTETGVNRGMLPEIVPSDSVIGRVTAEAARSFRLPEGIPVVKGGGDLSTTALATGAGEKGTLSLCVGTAAQLLFCLEEIDPDILGKLYLFSHCLPDKYFCLGTVPTGGSSVQWFASLVGDKAMKRLPAKINGLHDIPLNRNTLFYPFLMGTGTPSFDYQARAALFGLEMNTDQKDIALSIMEGVALALKSSLKKVPSLEKDVKRIIMSGGGTRLTLWPQIMGNVFNIPVQVSENVDTAATGAYLLGAKAIHFIDNYDDTINTTTPEAKCIPDPKFVSHYSKLYELYATFTDAVEKYSHWSER